MDPITTAIIAALSAGVASGTTEAGKNVVVDAYKALKQMIQEKFGKDNKVVEAANQLETTPKSKNQLEKLEEAIQLTNAEQDSELLKAAQHLINLVNPKQASVGKFNIQGNNIKSVVQAEHIQNLTQTIYNQYLEAPSQLSDYIKCAEFQATVEDRTKDFVGRKFVFEAVDEFLKESKFNSGYIVIRGEPGIGKTAIIAELVKRHAYVHHFNIASQNIRSPKDFLLNICAQLIVHYGLKYETLPSDASSNSGFLLRLLTEAVERADEQRVVVLVDAIDESEDISLPSDKSNRLFLPPVIPKGVFFIISAREEHDLRLKVDQRKDIYLIDDDPQNLDDVVKYIRRILENSAKFITPRIEAWGVNQEKFIDIIKDKSEGNFMYLVHVLRDIRDGKLTSDTVNDINKLPQGLRAYYQTHWRVMKANKQDRFEKLHEPVVCTLAVVREPVTINQLMQWVRRIAGVSLTPMLIKKVIDEWREFFNEHVTEDGEPRYRMYHTSFQDFLRDEVGLTPYHYNIVKTALDKIPGFPSKSKH